MVQKAHVTKKLKNYIVLEKMTRRVKITVPEMQCTELYVVQGREAVPPTMRKMMAMF